MRVFFSLWRRRGKVCLSAQTIAVVRTAKWRWRRGRRGRFSYEKSLQNLPQNASFCNPLIISVLKMADRLTAIFGSRFANLRGEICQISPFKLLSNHLWYGRNYEKSLQNENPPRAESRLRGYQKYYQCQSTSYLKMCGMNSWSPRRHVRNSWAVPADSLESTLMPISRSWRTRSPFLMKSSEPQFMYM